MAMKSSAANRKCSLVIVGDQKEWAVSETTQKQRSFNLISP